MSNKNSDYKNKIKNDILNQTKPSDFDGHTEFHNLNAEEKLLWLSECARFMIMIKNEGT